MTLGPPDHAVFVERRRLVLRPRIGSSDLQLLVGVLAELGAMDALPALAAHRSHTALDPPCCGARDPDPRSWLEGRAVELIAALESPPTGGYGLDDE